MAMNKFEEKKIEAEVLSELYETVLSKEKSIRTTYEVTGHEDEQAKDWRTGELLWEDEEKLIPKYRPKYEEVTRGDDDLSEEDRDKLRIYANLRTKLEKLL